MGGTRWEGINLPSNLLTLCGSGTTGCHGWIEHHPTYAEDHGWSVRQHERLTVAAVPVWTWRGWQYLEDDGTTRAALEHPGVAGCTCGCRGNETPADLWQVPEWA